MPPRTRFARARRDKWGLENWKEGRDGGCQGVNRVCVWSLELEFFTGLGSEKWRGE